MKLFPVNRAWTRTSAFRFALLLAITTAFSHAGPAVIVHEAEVSAALQSTPYPTVFVEKRAIIRLPPVPDRDPVSPNPLDPTAPKETNPNTCEADCVLDWWSVLGNPPTTTVSLSEAPQYTPDVNGVCAGIDMMLDSSLNCYSSATLSVATAGVSANATSATITSNGPVSMTTGLNIQTPTSTFTGAAISRLSQLQKISLWSTIWCMALLLFM